MPAPKAVLRDLYDFGMDPGKPWSVTHNVTGRLNPTPKPGAKHTGQHLNQVKFEPAKAEEAVKPVEKPTPAPKPVAKATVKAPEPVKEAPKVETLKEILAEKHAEQVAEAEHEAEKPAS